MIILGLNAFHGDSAAALVRDGKLVAAAEEERFRRVKHWAGFPSQAIAWCLEDAGVTLDQVDHIAVNQDSRANLSRKLRYLMIGRPNLGLVFGRLRNRRGAGAASGSACGRVSRDAVSRASPSGRASSRASVVGIPRFAVRGGDGRFGGWLRRLCQRRLGQGAGKRPCGGGEGSFSPLARHLLSGAHAISRLSALWGRVQGHGPGALRRATLHAGDEEDRPLEGRWLLRARPCLFPAPPRGGRVSMGWRSARSV